MRFQYAPLKSKPTIFQPTNPCPVCGAETALAEIAPHLSFPKISSVQIRAMK